MEKPLRVGLFGVGHLGKIHLKLLQSLENTEVTGIYDPQEAASKAAGETFGVTVFPDPKSLLEAVDAVDIVAPTIAHFELAAAALRAGKHVFIEKPLAQTPEEARALIELAAFRPDLVVQVGHVERFNPAFLALEGRSMSPIFIEGHRLAMYNPRGTDVSVVLDLMIHDLDIVLSLIDSPLREIHASGVSVISDTPDIANARLEFENGCVANLTASRISVKNMRRLRFFQKNAYLAVDFLEKKAEVFRLADGDEANLPPMRIAWEKGEQTRYLVFEQPEVKESNAILMELTEFRDAIQLGTPIRVSVTDGAKALETAFQILEAIDRHAERARPSVE